MEDHTEIRQFYAWILNQKNEDYKIQVSSEEKINLQTEGAYAEIFFYDDLNIVEFRITVTATGEVVFYLHFQPEDPSRCHELFQQLTESLIQLKQKKTVDIALCCSSGLTTGFFAEKLNEAAQILKLDYSFSALALEELLVSEKRHDAVLLAPQIAYEYEGVQSALPDTLVMKIQPAHFASYGTGQVIEEIRAALQKQKEHLQRTPEAAKALVCHNDQQVLLINVRVSHSESWFHTRIYDHGQIILDERVCKYGQDLTMEDMKDIICTADARGYCFDHVGISAPGIVHEGKISLHGFTSINEDIRQYFQSRCDLHTVIMNNMDAAAWGLYRQQNQYRSIVLLYQPMVHICGGAGIILNGKLLKSSHGSVGESKYLTTALLNQPKTDHPSPKTVLEVLGKSIASIQGLLGPDAFYICSGLTPDMDAIRASAAEHIPAEYIPDLIKVTDLSEPIFYGLLLSVLEQKEETAHE